MIIFIKKKKTGFFFPPPPNFPLFFFFFCFSKQIYNIVFISFDNFITACYNLDIALFILLHLLLLMGG